MPTREELHELIDSLPDAAMEAVHRILTQLQVWPLPPPPGAEEMRRRMEEPRMEVMNRQRPGTIGGFTGSSHYDPSKGAGASSFKYWDGDTFVQETQRRHLGNELKVIERIRVDGQRLIYKHEVTGPGEQRDERYRCRYRCVIKRQR
jgi:hypothetical protein